MKSWLPAQHRCCMEAEPADARGDLTTSGPELMDCSEHFPPSPRVLRALQPNQSCLSTTLLHFGAVIFSNLPTGPRGGERGLRKGTERRRSPGRKAGPASAALAQHQAPGTIFPPSNGSYLAHLLTGSNCICC